MKTQNMLSLSDLDRLMTDLIHPLSMAQQIRGRIMFHVKPVTPIGTLGRREKLETYSLYFVKEGENDQKAMVFSDHADFAKIAYAISLVGRDFSRTQRVFEYAVLIMTAESLDPVESVTYDYMLVAEGLLHTGETLVKIWGGEKFKINPSRE